MSSLIFYTDPDQTVIATDTLATSTNSNSPFCYTTKAFIVPHLKMIICGTGSLGVVSKWFIQINDGAIVRDIDHLDSHATKALQALWRDFVNDLNTISHITTTIYHFGFSQTSNIIHSYAYRSTNQFVSEPLEYGIGVKPVCAIPDDFKFHRDIKKLMELQRNIESKKPKNEQVYIGGEIVFHILDKQGFNITIHDRFDDYEINQSTMFNNYKKIKNS